MVRGVNRVTIGDVAKAARVSNAAVSLALNDRPGVSVATRRRVGRIAAELGWRPSIHARALLNRRAYAAGLVVARDPLQLATDTWFSLFIAGVESVLEAADYVLLLRFVGEDRERELMAYKRLTQEGRVDGFVVLDETKDDPRRRLLDELGVAHTLSVPGEFLNPVDGDATLDAVNHLVSLGHQRIAYVSGEESFLHSRQRTDWWRRAMKAHALNPRLYKSGHFTWEGGRRATLDLLNARQRPTAIMYASDTMAMAGSAAARELGLELPSDVSIVGFDDLPMAQHQTPRLTTIRKDAAAAGRTFAGVLLARIDDRPVDSETPPAHLVVRESTAPPRRA